MNADELRCIRRFLDNRDLIETLCVCKAWRVREGSSLFTEIKVTATDDLMVMIRRFLKHRQTIVRTVLMNMNLDEWPFSSHEMILVACRGSMPRFLSPPHTLRQFRYSHQYDRFVENDRYDRYLESMRKMEKLSIVSSTNPEDKK